MRAILYGVFAIAGVAALAVPSEADGAAAPEKNEKNAELQMKKVQTFEEKVEEAVDEGCDWLKKQQNPDGIFGKHDPNAPTYGGGTPHKYEVGRTAFPLQALCKSGVFPDEAEIQKAVEWLQKNYQAYADRGETTTYEDACVVNAIEAYYIGIWETKDRGLSPAKRKKDGIKRWGTEDKGAKDAKKNKKERKFKLDRKDEKVVERAVKSIEDAYTNAYGTGGWRYRKNGQDPGPKIDVSATQYAMLGFKAATRLGVGYEKKLLIDTTHFLLAEQDKDGPKVGRESREDGEGEEKKKDDDKKTEVKRYNPKSEDRARGWGYCRHDEHQPGDAQTYGSMTCAGICALIIIRDELEEDRSHKKTWEKTFAEKCDQAIYDGLAWMVTHWTVDGNPERGQYRYYYYLYALERLAMLGGIDEIGKHDWYFEGADVLLNQQEDAGFWDTKQEITPSDIWDTCYALLFLKKATEGIDRPVPVLTGRDGED